MNTIPPAEYFAMPPIQYYAVLTICMAIVAAVIQLSKDKSYDRNLLQFVMACALLTAFFDAVAIFFFPSRLSAPTGMHLLNDFLNMALLGTVVALFLGMLNAVLLHAVLTPDESRK